MPSTRAIRFFALAVFSAVTSSSHAADVGRHRRHPPIEVIPIDEYALFPAYMIGNPHCYLRHVEVNDHGVPRIVTQSVCS